PALVQVHLYPGSTPAGDAAQLLGIITATIQPKPVATMPEMLARPVVNARWNAHPRPALGVATSAVVGGVDSGTAGLEAAVVLGKAEANGSTEVLPSPATPAEPHRSHSAPLDGSSSTAPATPSSPATSLVASPTPHRFSTSIATAIDETMSSTPNQLSTPSTPAPPQPGASLSNPSTTATAAESPLDPPADLAPHLFHPPACVRLGLVRRTVDLFDPVLASTGAGVEGDGWGEYAGRCDGWVGWAERAEGPGIGGVEAPGWSKEVWSM
ncbi:hypothetical protein HDU93_006982, partial [Gonapodya sp. JEL0774]